MKVVVLKETSLKRKMKKILSQKKNNIFSKYRLYTCV